MEILLKFRPSSRSCLGATRVGRAKPLLGTHSLILFIYLFIFSLFDWLID